MSTVQNACPSEYTPPSAKYQLLIPERLSFIILIFFGLASIGLYLKMAALGNMRDKIPEYLTLYLGLSLTYLMASYFFTRKPQRAHLAAILFFAAVFRIILLLTPPSLSDDIYRYAWEGSLQTRGINPYRLPPESAELIPYRNQFWHHVNNKNASAIYPPLAQIFNAVVVSISPSLLAFKIAFLVLDGIVIGLIIRLLSQRGMHAIHVVFYAWNPLVIVETAGSGHHDVMVAALVLSAVLFCLNRREAKTMLAFSGAILSKVYPVVLAPFFLRRTRYRRWIWLPITLLAAYLPFVSAGSGLFAALLFYREKWRFNGFLFGLLSRKLSSEQLAERFLIFFLLIILFVCLWKMKDLLRQIYWVTGAVLLFAPALFPWYLVWIIPFLCFFPNPAWLLFTATSAISYYVLIDWWTLGVWRPDPFFVAIEYYPFLGLLAATGLQKVLSRRKVRMKAQGA